MISEQFCEKQIARIAGLPGFPRSVKPAINELVQALRGALTDKIALYVIDGIARYATSDTQCPLPGDLRMLIYDQNQKWKSENAEPLEERVVYCRKCDDFGIAESIDSVNLHSVASWCDCGAGQARQAGEKGKWLVDGIKESLQHPDYINAAREKLRLIFFKRNPIDQVRRLAQSGKRGPVPGVKLLPEPERTP